MSRAIVTLLLAMSLAHSTAQAGQLYRWVDSTGRVTYSDQPPPANTKQVQDMGKKGTRSTPETAQSGMETLVAKDKHPVTLYANACGEICDKAEAYLKQRNIPYARKDPTKDKEAAEEIRKMTGVLEVPVIRVGKTHLKGFDASSWGSVLDAAGYPSPVKPSTTP